MLGLGTAARRVGSRAFATAGPVSQEIRRRDQLHSLYCEFFPLKVESVKRPFAFQVLIRNRKQRITTLSASTLEKSFSSASSSCSQTKEIKYNNN